MTRMFYFLTLVIFMLFLIGCEELMVSDDVSEEVVNMEYQIEHIDGSYSGEVNSDNKPHGYGKAYDENGLIIYEGEFKDGLFHGEGIFYYKDGTVMYEGEWKTGKRHGYGNDYYPNGTILYEGEWEYNDRHGQGIIYYLDGTIQHEGKFKRNDIIR